MPVKSLQEFLEVIPGVVRPWSGLRMILYCKNRQFPVPDAFYGVVIEVKVGDFQ